MDDFGEYTKALIIMGMITVSVLVWFLVASIAGEVFDHKKTAPSDEPEVETPPTPEPAATPVATTVRPALDRTPADPRLLAAVSARSTRGPICARRFPSTMPLTPDLLSPHLRANAARLIPACLSARSSSTSASLNAASGWLSPMRRPASLMRTQDFMRKIADW